MVWWGKQHLDPKSGAWMPSPDTPLLAAWGRHPPLPSQWKEEPMSLEHQPPVIQPRFARVYVSNQTCQESSLVSQAGSRGVGPKGLNGPATPSPTRSLPSPGARSRAHGPGGPQGEWREGRCWKPAGRGWPLLACPSAGTPVSRPEALP